MNEPPSGRHDRGTRFPELEMVFRAESGRVVATLVRTLGGLDAAEDAFQDATVEALRTWPTSGVPANPGGWLFTVAKRRAIDRLRSDSRQRDRQVRAAARDPSARSADRDEWIEMIDAPIVEDDQLRLIFTCCHPALSADAQVALTLRTLCGLGTRDVARMFVVSEDTMTRRLTRAKAKIRTAGIPFRVPASHELPDRLPPVLAAIYLVFTEGYASTEADDLVRPEVCNEAIRLGRLLARLMPDEPEVQALVALMVLQHARRDARVDAAGDLVLLEEQDRSKWRRDEIAEGTAILESALQAAGGRPGPYAIQAAIAAVHANAEVADATDWSDIVALYELLEASTGNPVVTLNRAVAVSVVDGPARALDLLADPAVSARLEAQHRYHAVRAELLAAVGRTIEAVAAMRTALELVASPVERRHLMKRLADLTPATPEHWRPEEL